MPNQVVTFETLLAALQRLTDECGKLSVEMTRGNDGFYRAYCEAADLIEEASA